MSELQEQGVHFRPGHGHVTAAAGGRTPNCFRGTAGPARGGEGPTDRGAETATHCGEGEGDSGDEEKSMGG